MAGPRLLRAFAAEHPEARFVEIGSNDGEQHDLLRPLILGHPWRGVMVEPVPYVFARLQRNYAEVADRVALENVALADVDGTLPFFHLAEAEDAGAAGLPGWYDGIGSFSRAAVLAHGLDRPLVETEVPCLTFASLCGRHGLEELDLVLVDTEGHDAEILASIDLERHAPVLLVYEHYHLAPDERTAAGERLMAAGYLTFEEGFDTFCLGPRAGADLRRAFLRLRPAVPGVVAPALDLALHDERTPLPPGADADLRDDHPRLLELRAAYAAFDAPVTQRSRWHAAAVEGFLDLRYFRGESLFMWHRRDGVRATERRYRVWREHVAARDDLGLLDRLGEDGAFGCWTHAGVSRDLLDSVGELNFLERELALSTRDRLRILDVGAGYGRLAHRAAEALPNLADYCCVDAVPEATFLSEYYLGFRGVAPPARVVALPEVGDALRPGDFDLAVNVHSWSECPEAAVAWWVAELARLEVPHLFVVPNEPESLLSLEADGTRRDLAPTLAAGGYELSRREPVLDDAQVRALVDSQDHFHLYARR